MSPLLYSFLVLVLAVVTVTIGCIINAAALIIVGGMLFGLGVVKGSMAL